VFKAVSLLDRDISKLKMTIVGGTGDIGSACARVFAEKVLKLTVTGRTKKNLSKIKKELSKIKKSKIEATMDNESAVKEADIVIAAAGVSSSILNIDWFKAGSIVCDVGYPKNVSYSSAYRDDILVFSAGLSKIPSTMDFPIDIGLPSNEITYGCFAEAMILSLEKRYESFSFGRGNIYPEKIEEIRSLGEKHGFTVSPFYWADRLLDEQFLNILKEKMYV
ncbi:MAG: NAD(P)-binding domain-containing protein, partial [Candidatus Omnitrophica bacterium]|nr:NAD(P)-binding domain-containing protein [Candidatus Omnitrophota bacterium]